jgi:DNA-nicking Smr family endonuclease
MRKDSKTRIPIYTIDLHGYGVHFAWMRLKDQLELAKQQGCKDVRVIYGHGKMKLEIEKWLEALPVRRVKFSNDKGSLTARLI